MTEIQIYALIGLIIAVGLLFWFGYKMGRSDGLAAGITKGQSIERTDSQLQHSNSSPSEKKRVEA